MHIGALHENLFDSHTLSSVLHSYTQASFSDTRILFMKSVIETLQDLKYGKFIDSDNFTSLPENEIINQLGITIPHEYRDFLKSYPNTGYFFTDESVVCHGISSYAGAPDSVYLISSLFAQCSDSSVDLVAFRHSQDDTSEFIPLVFLVIGDGDGGNYICMDLRPETIGQIYFWAHDHQADESGMHLLANSFNDFIARLAIQQ